MAPTTWRNIDAPDFTRSSQILNSAVGHWSGAFNNLGDAFSKGGDIVRRSKSADANLVLAGVSGEDGVDPALAKIAGTTQGYNMTPELQAAMLNIRGAAMGYDSKRAAEERARAAEGRARAASARSASAAASSASRKAAEDADMAALAPHLIRMREAAWENGTGDVNPQVPEVMADALTGGAGGGVAPAEASVPGSSPSAEPVMGVDAGASLPLVPTRPGGGETSYDIPLPQSAGPAAMPTFEEVYANPDATLEQKAAASTSVAELAQVYPNAPLSDLLTFVDLNHQAKVEAGLASDEDRERDFADGQATLEFNRSEESRKLSSEAAVEADQWIQKMGSSEDLPRVINEVFNSDSPPEYKSAVIAAMRDRVEQQPELFGPVGSNGANLALEMAAAQIEGSSAQFEATNMPARVAATLVNGSRGGGSGGPSASGGEGLDPDAPVEAGVARLMGMPGVEWAGGEANLMAAVGRISRDTGLAPNVILAVAESEYTVKSGGLFGLSNTKVKLDEDRLTELVSALGDPVAFQAQLAEAFSQEVRTKDVQTMISTVKQNEQEIQILLGRNSPEAHARAEQLAAENAELEAGIQGRLIQDGDINKYNPPGAAPQPTDMADQMTRAFSSVVGDPGTDLAMPDGNRLLRPGETDNRPVWEQALGNPDQLALDMLPVEGAMSVNPEAPPVVQALARATRDSAEHNDMRFIENKLRGLGAGGVSGAMGTFMDNFQNPADIEIRRAERGMATEALDWYESAAAQELFTENPDLRAKAKRDPVAFYLRNSDGAAGAPDTIGSGGPRRRPTPKPNEAQLERENARDGYTPPERVNPATGSQVKIDPQTGLPEGMTSEMIRELSAEEFQALIPMLDANAASDETIQIIMQRMQQLRAQQ